MEFLFNTGQFAHAIAKGDLGLSYKAGPTGGFATDRARLGTL
jgi:hypothetical protein